MRLPGTINIPNATKLKKGRKPALAKLVEWHEDRIYELNEFIPAPSPQRSSAKRLDALVPCEVKDVSTLDVAERVKIMIVQGSIPGESKDGDNSRSALLFDCLCSLYRSGISEHVMYSIITDAGFGISASVLDKGRKYKEYAQRQIARAKERVDADTTGFDVNKNKVPVATYRNARIAIQRLGLLTTSSSSLGIFDNYVDAVDGDFIKKLAPDYNLLDYGYRAFVTKEVIPGEPDYRISLLEQMLALAMQALALLLKLKTTLYGVFR